MKTISSSSGGENFSLRDILLKGRKLSLSERTQFFSDWINARADVGESLYLRTVTSEAGREVDIIDPLTHEKRRMLMFGSNNYLGLTTHPHVRERVRRAVDEYGVGVGGPPLLNGYTRLCRELEERLSAFKGQEDTLIFSSGYGANVGLVNALVGKNDALIYDAYCHASLYDGLKMSDAPGMKFSHNDLSEMRRLIESVRAGGKGEVFVGVEGVYSMDGDLAPLDQIASICRQNEAILIVDDAHGTGVVGPQGRGTGAHFGVEEDIDILMGTFSKAFGVTGGFISTSKPIADYLRFFARSYMFSASLSPLVIAAVLGGLEVMENEPELIRKLWENVAYLTRGLRKLGFDVDPQTAIIPLIVPETMNIRKAGIHFHRAGIFLNSIEYPAVPVSQQRFRISMMATHTKEDIDRLLEVTEEVWTKFAVPKADQPEAV